MRLKSVPRVSIRRIRGNSKTEARIMIRVDRCGFCKYCLSKKGERFRCKAFPDTTPRYFYENGGECANGYRFEVIPEREEEYKSLWGKKGESHPRLDPPIIVNERVSIE